MALQGITCLVDLAQVQTSSELEELG